MNNKINRLHERALRIAYKDYASSFESLLEKDGSVTIHQKNVQLLMNEMFKTTNNLNPSFMDEIFLKRSARYNLRNTNTFLLPMVHTVNHGTETNRYRGQRIWRSLPQEIIRIQILCNNLRITSNIGKMTAATADFAGSTFLGSDFYRFYTIFNMNFVNWYELCNFIDLYISI